jgi:hypothetical protein
MAGLRPTKRTSLVKKYDHKTLFEQIRNIRQTSVRREESEGQPMDP